VSEAFPVMSNERETSSLTSALVIVCSLAYPRQASMASVAHRRVSESKVTMVSAAKSWTGISRRSPTVAPGRIGCR
jgi:hypothetical protein